MDEELLALFASVTEEYPDPSTMRTLTYAELRGLDTVLTTRGLLLREPPSREIIEMCAANLPFAVERGYVVVRRPKPAMIYAGAGLLAIPYEHVAAAVATAENPVGVFHTHMSSFPSISDFLAIQKLGLKEMYVATPTEKGWVYYTVRVRRGAIPPPVNLYRDLARSVERYAPVATPVGIIFVPVFLPETLVEATEFFDSWGRRFGFRINVWSAFEVPFSTPVIV